MSATAAAVVGTAVSGALIGVASTAAVNVATGQSITSGLGKGALLGGISGGFAGYAGASANAASSAFVQGTGTLSQLTSANALAALAPSTTSIAFGSALGALMPSAPDYSGYTPAAQQNIFQQHTNSTPYAITGSGGKQASSSLAEAINRTKKRKLTQDDVSDLSIDTSSFSSTGLQFA
jgi:hypothetical protein